MDYNQIETNLMFKLMSSHWHNKGNSILVSATFINLVHEYHHTFIRDKPNIITTSLNFTTGNSTLIIRISSFRINTSISSNTKRHESAIFLFKDQQQSLSWFLVAEKTTCLKGYMPYSCIRKYWAAGMPP